MSDFKFSIPIQVRYGDLDPQWHVNNSRFLTYLEQGRFEYLHSLKLFDGRSFFDLGLIVADIHVAYLAPIELGQNIHVFVKTTKIGNKSLVIAYEIRADIDQKILATGETVMVAYDYHTHQSIPVPEAWRNRIQKYENL